MSVGMKQRIATYINPELGVVGFYVNDCPNCGVISAITYEYEQRRRKDGKSFYCPNGHIISFGQSESDKLRTRLEESRKVSDNLRSSLNATHDQLEASERSKAAVKGHLTRMRNRINNGVCPVQGCQRSFINIKAHIENKHPQWMHDHKNIMEEIPTIGKRK